MGPGHFTVAGSIFAPWLFTCTTLIGPPREAEGKAEDHEKERGGMLRGFKYLKH